MKEYLLTSKEISEIIPHRYPFLLVDRIISMEPGKKITGIKNVTVNEEFFLGHFPGTPIMPGVLIIEALAQAGGILAVKSTNLDKGTLVLFIGIDKAKFRRQVIPGDQLRLELEVIQQRASYWKLKGKAFVEEKLACEAELTAMVQVEN